MGYVITDMYLHTTYGWGYVSTVTGIAVCMPYAVCLTVYVYVRAPSCKD